MSAISPSLTEIDDRIAIIRGNLRDLIEQAASFSGAGGVALSLSCSTMGDRK